MVDHRGILCKRRQRISKTELIGVFKATPSVTVHLQKSRPELIAHATVQDKINGVVY